MNAKQLSLLEGRARRDVGREKAASAHGAWLNAARARAVLHCERYVTVTSDDIQQQLPLPEGAHPNLWGSVFNDPRFEPAGYTQTTRPKGHARIIRIWKLKSEAAIRVAARR